MIIPIVIFKTEVESFDDVDCPLLMIWVTGEEVGANVIGEDVIGDDVVGDRVDAEGLDEGPLDG